MGHMWVPDVSHIVTLSNTIFLIFSDLAISNFVLTLPLFGYEEWMYFLNNQKKVTQLYLLLSFYEVHAPSATISKFQNKNGAIILYTFRTILSELEFCTPSPSPVFTTQIWGLEARGPTIFEFQNKIGAIILYTFRTILYNRARILYTVSFPSICNSILGAGGM